ncbi:hypothetical protein CJ030_MR4G016891 [Morella rubra]|uniref:Reverse transcriptase zinc-binding domain-containing protein n=1 Tax=Morella rubra TaxID=262757 RepID=A0A6A1VS74_9ROSI|nr:hypothetical protein CJ030_MR4G016891 [Morella rubra]
MSGLPPSPWLDSLGRSSTSLVSHFFHTSSKLWNLNLLRSTFDPLSVDKILQISIPPLAVADKLIWTLDSKGIFSVKSAYHQVSSNRLSSLVPLSLIDWKQLWRLNMHERLKFFLWKVALDILPMRQRIALNLHSHFQGDISCLLCGHSTESTHQLLFTCDYTRALWRLSPWSLNVEFFLLDFTKQNGYLKYLVRKLRFVGILVAPLTAHDLRSKIHESRTLLSSRSGGY